jgi:hypothetical protein
MQSHTPIQLFHIFIVGALFLYIGMMRQNTASWIFPLLIVLGFILILFHSYKTYIKLNNKVNPWYNLIHILLIAPLLLWIGFNAENTSRPYFEMLLMLGFVAITYNLYYLIQ